MLKENPRLGFFSAQLHLGPRSTGRQGVLLTIEQSPCKEAKRASRPLKALFSKNRFDFLTI